MPLVAIGIIMRQLTYLTIIVLVLFPSCLERKADKIFLHESQLQELFDGGKGTFLEGPVVASDGIVLFTFLVLKDSLGQMASQIMTYDPKTGQTKKFKDTSGIPNGLAFDQYGNLIICNPKNRMISRQDMQTGKEEIVAESFDGRPFDEPNDVAVDLSGNVYFSDPIFRKKDTVYQDIRGVYQVASNGKIELIATNAENPNGLILSPDQKKLYVADSPFIPGAKIQRGGAILLYEIQKNGKFSFSKRLVEFDGDGPDGLAVDKDGNLYVALYDAYKIAVYNPFGESLDELIIHNIHPTNVAFGRGEYKNILFITTENSLLSIETSQEGFNIPLL